jgi:arylsulfatase A-like enzyme
MNSFVSRWIALGAAALTVVACDPDPPRRAGPPNVVVISIDGLRLDRTGFGGGPNPSTPNLDALVADSAWFPQAFSQSNESLLSHASLFTGRYPLEISVPDYLRFTVGPDALTLAEVMQQLGYDTSAFISEGHLGAGFGLAQGFGLFFEGERWGSLQETVPVALTWLEQRIGTDATQAPPFFMFLHGYDCHRSYMHGGLFHEPFGDNPLGKTHPLDRSFNATEKIIDGVHYPGLELERAWHASGMRILDPQAYSRAVVQGRTDGVPLNPETLDHIRDHYDSGVLAADTYVGLFLEGLDHMGLWQDTVVIILSDHGEDLQHHGFTNHRAVVRDTTTRVPMIIGGGAIPDAWRGTVREEVVDAVDLVPTVTALADAIAPAGVRGRSLVAVLNGDADVAPKDLSFQTGVLGQLSVRSATHRLVFASGPLSDPNTAATLQDSPLDRGAFALYHTAKDPLEQVNILTSEPKLASELRGQLSTWYATLERSTDARPLTSEQRKLLQDGGYW